MMTAKYSWTVVVLAATFVSAALAVRPNTESNDIISPPDNSFRDLPTCRRHSACAFIQANNKGINVQPMCACSVGRKCPLSWDSRDGHSITQGSDQYKFCDRVQHDVLRCNPLQLAYTTVMEFTKDSSELEAFSAQVHCACPDEYTYELLDMLEEENQKYELIISKYTCQKLKTCGSGDMCRELTESPDSFLVKNVCACPRGFTCPSNPEASFQSEMYGRGVISMIRCQ